MNKTATIKKFETNTDFEVRSLDAMCLNKSTLQHPWWYNFWFRLGLNGSLPRAFVCTNRNRCLCNYYYLIECNSRNVGLWFDKRKIATLIFYLSLGFN